MQNCDTAVRYQMYHTLALVAVGLLALRHNSTALTVTGVCFFFGVVLFSGFLYGFVFTGNRTLVHVVPFGGVLLILGWLALAWAALGTSTGESK
jgi:uncharacterized membrane protein YgdD (TMEM256/DUF423 family)